LIFNPILWARADGWRTCRARLAEVSLAGCFSPFAALLVILSFSNDPSGKMVEAIRVCHRPRARISKAGAGCPENNYE
jgi:hypothetical protein